MLDGPVARRVEDTVPPRVHDRLTALREWARQNAGRVDDHRTRTEADRAVR